MKNICSHIFNFNPTNFVGTALLNAVAIIIFQASIINPAVAQVKLYSPEKTRILFLLDGSGSMVTEWNGRTKFEVAQELLIDFIDSIETTHKDVEFGLRIFGHQSSKTVKDCQDSKLEINFSGNNVSKIRSVLEKVEPKGYTPIAYSLLKAAEDFSTSTNSTNAIILITDGLESCDGDPCATSEALQNKRITLKPFIIGLGLSKEDQEKFNCVGTYYDAQDKVSFSNSLNVVISQTLNKTTTQINLLDYYGSATETNVEITLYDGFTGQVRYNLVHAFQSSGNPDTLLLDPLGRYDLTIHTMPPVTKKNIELVPGKHNYIAVDAPQGELTLEVEGGAGFTDIPCLVRKKGTGEIVNVQNFNTSRKYIVGKYDLEILTLPRIEQKDFNILSGKENLVRIPKPGQLTMQAGDAGIVSIYISKDNKLHKVYESTGFTGRETIKIQPGQYQVVFRPNRNKRATSTRVFQTEVFSGRNSNLRF